MHNLIVDRELELLNELQFSVLDYRDLLLACSDQIATLDCLVAFADCARRYNWVYPEMTDDNVLEIDEGRHPLLEKLVTTVVPNSARLVGKSVAPRQDAAPSLILLTGANFSGKSIYMKQIALIVFLAHIGSFVPARAAKIGLTDRILLRMNTRDSVTRPASTFLHDLQQVDTALRLMTSRSLVLIDEFGKGTHHTDGAALMGSLIERLADPTGVMPKCVVATHFHELLDTPGQTAVEPLLHLPTNVRLMHMRIKLSETQLEEGDDEAEVRQLAAGTESDIVCLYEIAEGPTFDSYGINCARLAGMPRGVVNRARELLRLTADGTPLADVVNLPSSGRSTGDTARHAAIAERFAAWDLAAEPIETLHEKLRELLAG